MGREENLPSLGAFLAGIVSPSTDDFRTRGVQGSLGLTATLIPTPHPQPRLLCNVDRPSLGGQVTMQGGMEEERATKGLHVCSSLLGPANLLFRIPLAGH